jgi:1-acyl-sn-glycerol-3-phosphate acyltransferase
VAASTLPRFARASAVFLRVVFKLLTRVRVDGLEHIPESGPVLVVINHCSNVDGMLMIGYVIPRFGRPFAWPGKAEAMRWPLVGYAMKQNGVFGVRRGAGDLESFRIARQVLDEGRVLAIFPEGTRSRTGALQEAKEGATVLAARSGAPILPIGISGSHRFWPRGSLPRPFRGMRVRIGESFRLEMPRTGDRKEDLRLATAELMGRIAALLPPDQRGVYADNVSVVVTARTPTAGTDERAPTKPDAV